MNRKQVLDIFKELSGNNYKDFSQSLIPTNKNQMLGVRIPQIKDLAKTIVKENWNELLEDYGFTGNKNFNPDSLFYEDIMLIGQIINKAKMPLEERLKLTQKFIPLIDNWAVCDTFCCSQKWIKPANKEQVWDFTTSLIPSCKEFEQRFVIISLMANFLQEQYITEIFALLEKISYGSYYVDMAVAWLLATAMAKCNKQTKDFIPNCKIPKDVLKKFLQKCRDSYRVSQEDCQWLRKNSYL